MRVIIPAAGEGARFRLAGYQKPKPFVDVAGRPMIEHVIRNVAPRQANVHVLLRKQHIESEPGAVGSMRTRGYVVHEVDRLTEGTACTLLLARAAFDDDKPVLVANSDQVVDFSVDAFVRDCLDRNLDGSILVFKDAKRDPKWSIRPRGRRRFGCGGCREEADLGPRHRRHLSVPARIGLRARRRRHDRPQRPRQQRVLHLPRLQLHGDARSQDRHLRDPRDRHARAGHARGPRRLPRGPGVPQQEEKPVKVVVPLAGPDFEREDGTVKAGAMVDGQPLLRRCLEGRAWWQSGQVRPKDVVFVLRDTPRSRSFAASSLASWYPEAHIVTLSATTGGAAFSALAGVALVGQDEGALCVDLVDIDYRSTFDPLRCFARTDVGAAALVFTSSNPLYSYLRTDAAANVVEAAEKRVISSHASAGHLLLRLASSLSPGSRPQPAAPRATDLPGLFFVCPLFNGVIDSGRRVVLEPVHDVRDMKVA